MENDRYYILRENSKSEAYSNLQDATSKAQNGQIIIDRFKGYVKVENTNPWRLCQFEFYNKEGEKYFLKLNEWSIYNIEIIYKTGKYIKFITEIRDPKLQSRVITKQINKTSNFGDYNDNDIIAVIESKNILLEYSQFSHWKEIEILEENKRLKAEIQKLREK